MLFGTVLGFRGPVKPPFRDYSGFRAKNASPGQIDGDIPILGPDFIAERHSINW